MSLIPHKPEKTRHWKQRRKSRRGMQAGKPWALISHVCCCQTKCLCFWEVFPCWALSDSNWDFIYYHQIYHEMNTLGQNKHIVGWMPNARTIHHKDMQYSLRWFTHLFLRKCISEETTESKLHIKLLLHWLNRSLFCVIHILIEIRGKPDTMVYTLRWHFRNWWHWIVGGSWCALPWEIKDQRLRADSGPSVLTGHACAQCGTVRPCCALTSFCSLKRFSFFFFLPTDLTSPSSWPTFFTSKIK